MSKKETIQVFEEKQVRTVWDAGQEKWYLSIIDVIEILTGTDRPSLVSRDFIPDEAQQLGRNGLADQSTF